jgi:hypothetical protein
LVRDLLLGGPELAQRSRSNKADQQAQNGEHDEKLEQGEAALACPRIVTGSEAAPVSGFKARLNYEQECDQTAWRNHRVVQVVE